ncbi:glycoside hydrolase family 71 protein [Xylariaceae sp. FL0255]|nr:glycoside hydrolase family 71 protein [Xylariaceae sp. FL0255]
MQKLLVSLAFVGSALAGGAAPTKAVWAHYIVGLTDGQSQDQWTADIQGAKAAGINGFALDIGSADSWNPTQLPLAYNTAADNDFLVFLSFDQGASTWDQDDIVDYINTYKVYDAQAEVNNLPLVSTFEGPSSASIWPAVRDSTGGIFFIPDWSSLGAAGVESDSQYIDGAFNWGAWPNANEYTMDDGNDVAYVQDLGGKAYMMGVSPYFYTDLPQYDKNWYSSSDSLWFDRWSEVFTINPTYIELITWNDYGESSYLNNVVDSQIVSGASEYVSGFDHSGFLFTLPYLISAYQADDLTVSVPTEGAMAWYRTTPATQCSDGGTVWGQGGTASAADGTKDVISVIALSNSANPTVTVQIGSGSAQTLSATSTLGNAYFFQTSFSGQTGAVTLTFNGQSTTGPEIQDACPSSGNVNFNAVTIQV